MKNIVISQPMYFPWIGLLEQIRCADVFVFYDDVQFSRGFINRVQIKKQDGVRWLTVPTKKFHQVSKINEIILDNSMDWKKQHLNYFKNFYNKSEYLNDALKLIDEVFSHRLNFLSDIGIYSTKALARYFGLDDNIKFYKSSDLNISGSSSKRLRDISAYFKCKNYISGHGALNYLDVSIFEKSNIDVRIMDYQKKKYSQQNGEFNPFVSALDLVANCGKDGEVVGNCLGDYAKF